METLNNTSMIWETILRLDNSQNPIKIYTSLQRKNRETVTATRSTDQNAAFLETATTNKHKTIKLGKTLENTRDLLEILQKTEQEAVTVIDLIEMLNLERSTMAI